MSLADEIRNAYMLRREQIYTQAPEMVEEVQLSEHVEDRRAKLKALQNQLEMRLRKKENHLGMNEVDGFQGEMFSSFLDGMVPKSKTISLSFNGDSISSISFG